MSDVINVDSLTQVVAVNTATQEIIVVEGQPQNVIIQQPNPSVAVENAGPVGPRGYSGDDYLPVPEDPDDDGKALLGSGGTYVLAPVLGMPFPMTGILITQDDFENLPLPRDSSLMYFIGDF